MDLVDRVREQVEVLFAGMPAHHGMDHVLRVYQNSLLAVGSVSDVDQKATVLIAALLHDADDHKLFRREGKDPSSLPNAMRIMDAVGVPPSVQKEVALAIKLVSTSSQASCETAVVQCPAYLYIPRDADRLDALGLIGFERCLAFGRERGHPLYLPETPLPTTLDDLLAAATVERFENYKKGKMSSVATIDHFFDKLLHFKTADSGNLHLAEKIHLARQELIDAVLELIRTIKSE